MQFTVGFCWISIQTEHYSIHNDKRDIDVLSQLMENKAVEVANDRVVIVV